MPNCLRYSFCVFFSIITFLTLTSKSSAQPTLKKTGNKKPATTLADLSGLAWTGGNSFIAVHDAKIEDELFKPRVANLQLPVNLRGITFTDQRVTYRGRTPNDLESAASIPGSNNILLVESGDSKNDPAIQRIFKASAQKNRVRIISQTTWPVNILNVEGTAVAQLDGRYFFVFAERADNQPSTELSWIEFDPKKMRFKKNVSSVKFDSPNPQRFNRVIVGLDIDSNGFIYSVSAFDAEAAGLPDPDNGPFAAGVYMIGQIKLQNKKAAIELFPQPVEYALLDGFKVESVAVRELDKDEPPQLFIGTDDENYGGTLRQLPLPILR
ncbi:hypothetical protein N9Z44_04055 [Mariniblastus sp.]|nr:hypothetical protein [Mariniblastus sp.]